MLVVKFLSFQSRIRNRHDDDVGFLLNERSSWWWWWCSRARFVMGLWKGACHKWFAFESILTLMLLSFRRGLNPFNRTTIAFIAFSLQPVSVSILFDATNPALIVMSGHNISLATEVGSTAWSFTGGPAVHCNPSIPIRFYYRIRELNF